MYHDKTHNTDGSHTVEEGNINLYHNTCILDTQLSKLFNTIHQYLKRHIELFETLGVLTRGSYFSEEILGEGGNNRTLWIERALTFVRDNQSSVICLDPDNGIEPSSMVKLSIIKQSKYATFNEIERFFELKSVEHMVIYQHFNRQKKHNAQMNDAKRQFEQLYEGRAVVTIIRHNSVQARFYIILSKKSYILGALHSLEELIYGSRAFFSVL